MPRNFFHLRRGGATVPEREGVELAALEQAAAEAIRRGREIATREVLRHCSRRDGHRGRMAHRPRITVRGRIGGQTKNMTASNHRDYPVGKWILDGSAQTQKKQKTENGRSHLCGEPAPLRCFHPLQSVQLAALPALCRV